MIVVGENVDHLRDVDGIGEGPVVLEVEHVIRIRAVDRIPPDLNLTCPAGLVDAVVSDDDIGEPVVALSEKRAEGSEGVVGASVLHEQESDVHAAGSARATFMPYRSAAFTNPSKSRSSCAVTLASCSSGVPIVCDPPPTCSTVTLRAIA